MPRTKKELINSLKGMHDILPGEQVYWDKVRKVTFNIAKFYGFGYLETPIVEETALFKRTLGEDSDVVGKEMYSFRTKGNDISLRPEGTAGVARAYIQHGWASLPQPKKVFYYGPMFRHEKPQSGRFRSFHQFGFEMLGIEDALADAEIVQMTHALLRDLGVKNFLVEVNTIGDKDDRIKYKKELKEYFKPHMKKLCADCKNRYKANPLRILDCKKETCQEFVENAPQIIDHVSDAAKNHFKRFLEFLDQSEIPYLLNPRLVRGLDYYNRTVFEFYEEDNRTSQGALASGGRYDSLVKLLGGKNTAAVGVAGGIERIIGIMKEKGSNLSKTKSKVFLVQLGELAKKRGLSLMEEFRKAGIHIEESLGRHSIRSQMKIADKMGVKLALILGQKEALADEIIIRDMKSGAQETIALDRVMKEIKRRLKP